MGIRIRVGGLVVEVDNEADLRMALAALNGASPTSSERKANGKSDPVVDLWKALPPNQRKLLRTVAESPDGVTDIALRKTLAMRTNMALGGVTAGLTKNAKRFDLGGVELLTKEEHTGESGERVTIYRVPADIKRRLPAKQGRPSRKVVK